MQSRAIYAVDLMLEWEKGAGECRCTVIYKTTHRIILLPRIFLSLTHTDGSESIMQPKILEVNFSPDCVRACKYHPDFYNHVFEALFLEKNSWRKDLPITKLL